MHVTEGSRLLWRGSRAGGGRVLAGAGYRAGLRLEQRRWPDGNDTAAADAVLGAGAADWASLSASPPARRCACAGYWALEVRAIVEPPSDT
jgi:hypothetical protein